MAFEKRDNSGALFKNTKKEKETHPDYNGDVMVDGIEYWISGWRKQDRNGDTFLSVSFKVKEQKPAAQPARTRDDPRTMRREIDDSIPDPF